MWALAATPNTEQGADMKTNVRELIDHKGGKVWSVGDTSAGSSSSLSAGGSSTPGPVGVAAVGVAGVSGAASAGNASSGAPVSQSVIFLRECGRASEKNF